MTVDALDLLRAEEVVQDRASAVADGAAAGLSAGEIDGHLALLFVGTDVEAVPAIEWLREQARVMVADRDELAAGADDVLALAVFAFLVAVEATRRGASEAMREEQDR